MWNLCSNKTQKYLSNILNYTAGKKNNFWNYTFSMYGKSAQLTKASKPSNYAVPRNRSFLYSLRTLPFPDLPCQLVQGSNWLSNSSSMWNGKAPPGVTTEYNFLEVSLLLLLERQLTLRLLEEILETPQCQNR